MRSAPTGIGALGIVWAHLKKHFKHPLESVGRNTDPSLAYADHCLVSLAVERQGNVAAALQS